MKRTTVLSVALLVLFLGFASYSTAEVQHWKVDEIKAGMTGDGYTVFNGHKREKFNFRITGLQDTGEGVQFLISVWRNVGGKKIRFNVASGMSGSPLYIKGKLVGAVASGWEKETNEGTAKPFQFMYDEAEQGKRFRQLYRGIRYPFDETDSSFRELTPGSSIKIGFVTGDQALSNYAMGTVTAIDRDTGVIYVLGHPLEIPSRRDAPNGPVSFTAWEGGVAGTVNDVGEKVPAWDVSKGQRARIWFNGTHGIYGTLDEVAETIPMTLEVNSPGFSKKIGMEIPYGNATLSIAQITVEHFLNSYLESLGEITVDFNGAIILDDGQIVPISERFTHTTLDARTFSSMFLSQTYFFGGFSQILTADSHIRYSSLRLSFNVKPLGPILAIHNVLVLKSVVHPGENLNIVVQIVEKGNLKTSARRYEPVIEAAIPKDTPSGNGKVIVETGEAYVDRRSEFSLPPTNVDELAKNITRNARSNDSFYISVLVPMEKGSKKTDDLKKSNKNEPWRKLNSNETLFAESMNSFPPVKMTAPLPNAVIITDQVPNSGRYEISFRIETAVKSRYRSVIDKAVTVLIGIFWIGIAFACFQVWFFVATKVNPLADKLWIYLVNAFNKRRKS